MFLAFSANGIAKIPAPMDPPRLVNDFALVFNSIELQALESKLLAYADSTSTQVVVVTVTDLEGEAPWYYATQLGNEWGVGQKGKNNGVVILLKPKTDESKGEVAIAPGYGLEHVVTDALSKRIIETKMIPFFKEGRLYEGVDAAVNDVMLLASGQYKSEVNNEISGWIPFVVFLVITLLLVLVGIANNKSKRNTQFTMGSGLTGFFLADMISRAARNGGGGSSSSLGGGFGGSSFGGFGGGSFGGGGASGSW